MERWPAELKVEGFDSRDQTNTLSLKIVRKEVKPLPCCKRDEPSAKQIRKQRFIKHSEKMRVIAGIETSPFAPKVMR